MNAGANLLALTTRKKLLHDLANQVTIIEAGQQSLFQRAAVLGVVDEELAHIGDDVRMAAAKIRSLCIALGKV